MIIYSMIHILLDYYDRITFFKRILDKRYNAIAKQQITSN
jgi:hypothetical protein